jgi:hypothetical protein
MSNHQALVAPIRDTRPILGADKIVLAFVAGYNVIIGTDVKEGDLGLFFTSELCLSPEFCEKNNLFRKKDPETGENIGGYFEPNARVRAIKLKGAKSEGFWIPLDSLSYTSTNIKSLKDGDQIDVVNGFKICEKYYTPATRRRMNQNKSSLKKKENLMFHKHVDTEQLKRSLNEIHQGDILHISVKQHGTSGRTTHCLDEVPIPRGKIASFFAKLFKRPETRKEWRYLTGSRNVILEKSTGDGFYKTDEFRYNAIKNINLHKGETLFYELVGYVDDTTPIMATHDSTKLKDKNIEKRFGKTITYTYGCAPGECALYVYRITQTNEDGYSVDLSWPQVVARSTDLGLKTVPHLETFIYDGNSEALLKKVDKLTNGDSGVDAVADPIDRSHPLEGIVLRVESCSGKVFWLKEKCLIFKILEGIMKEDDSIVDLEEVS